MKEIWKPIQGWETYYHVSNKGRVKNIKTGKLLKITKDSRNYYRVRLHSDGMDKTIRIHRLVGIHFLSNPDNFEEINHIDENKQNNRVDNLEWCSRKYNVNFGSRTVRQAQNVSKPIVQSSIAGEVISRFPSISEAAKQTGFAVSSIGMCCRGHRKQACGFQWGVRL